MKMLVGGKKINAKDNDYLEVVNSATQEFIDTVPNATIEDVQQAISIAQKGKKVWRSMSPKDRGDILLRCAEAIEQQQEELATLLSTEMGKVISEARDEISVVSLIFKRFVEKANSLYGETITNNDSGKASDIIFTRREPLGVIACIVPFNYPAELCSHKIAPALAAGNAVIIKPPTDNPLTIIRLVEILLENGVPGNVVQVLTGDGALIGGELAKSPFIDAISLTGSTEVGKIVARDSASTLKRVFLELGGNDPLLILEDADLELAVEEAVKGRLKNAGQTCCAPKRFIVHQAIKDSFIEKLIERLKRVRRGGPLENQTELGSLISPKAVNEIHRQVHETMNQGAKCILGGSPESTTYYQPTILVDVTPEMDVAKDMEIFGPVLPIIEFESNQEAIEIANNSIYGLAGGVITSDFKKAIDIAAKLECGSVVINGSGNYRNVDMPFGGYKMSGLGREGITCTLEEMTQEKSYVLKNVLL